MQKIGPYTWRAEQDGVIHFMKTYTNISTHALADINFHFSNENLGAVEQICRYYGVDFLRLSHTWYKLTLRDRKKPVPAGLTRSVCKSIW